MTLFLTLFIVWTAAAAAAVYGLWRKVTTHRKVYGLIAVHAVYSAGVFFLYAHLVGP